MEAELREVVEEANALSTGPVQWGTYIFQSASEMVGRDMLDKQLEKVEESRQEEKESWERRRENVRAGFLEEIGVEDVKVKEEKQEQVDEKKVQSRTSSDDSDAVLVEGGGPAEEPQSPVKSTPTTPSSSKKKKGKK